MWAARWLRKTEMWFETQLGHFIQQKESCAANKLGNIKIYGPSLGPGHFRETASEFIILFTVKSEFMLQLTYSTIGHGGLLHHIVFRAKRKESSIDLWLPRRTLRYLSVGHLQKEPKFSASTPMDILFKLAGNQRRNGFKEQHHTNC